MGVPAKDDSREMRVPEVWRPTLTAVVDSLVRGDISIGAQVPSVRPTPPALSQQCLQAIADYGDVTLIPLPEEAWEVSVAMWYGDRWRCLVDLWTREEGRSDLVLDVDVFENTPGYRFSVHLVYVP
jgi:hypothetical protein